jgi:hypothetical protein
MKPKVFKGDTFRALLLQYSFSRMSTDPAYRREVRKALAEKKAERRGDAQKEQVGA